MKYLSWLIFVSLISSIFITLYLKGQQDFIHYRTLIDGNEALALAAHYSELEYEHGGPLLFATNAGMFHDDGSTVGLYIQNRKEIYPINTEEGTGNFFLKPNGVFWFGDGAVGVESTESYLKNARSPRFATQSGPMLVIDGVINPNFSKKSKNKNIRSGVCAMGEEVLFILSTEDVTFYDLAQEFQAAGCNNALYLDGYLSDFWIDGKDQVDRGYNRYRTFFLEYEM